MFVATQTHYSKVAILCTTMLLWQNIVESDVWSNFKRNFCKQLVENLIRRCVLLRLIWFCRCPTKRTLGLQEGLDSERARRSYYQKLYNPVIRCDIAQLVDMYY